MTTARRRRASGRRGLPDHRAQMVLLGADERPVPDAGADRQGPRPASSRPGWLPDGSRNRLKIQRLKDKCGNKSNAIIEVEFHDLHRRDARRGRPRHPHHHRDGASDAARLRDRLRRADAPGADAGVHHATHRRAFQRALVDQPIMRNVLADLAVESEAMMWLAMRVAAALDRAGATAPKGCLSRIATPIAKYWACKRAPQFVVEALECHGGNGFIADHLMARLYREAPLNGIWEGIGNVICLDVLRSMQREPESVPALLDEIARRARRDPRSTPPSGTSKPTCPISPATKARPAASSSAWRRFCARASSSATPRTRWRTPISQAASRAPGPAPMAPCRAGSTRRRSRGWPCRCSSKASNAMIAHLPLTFVALIAAAGMAMAHPLDSASSQPIGPMELEIIQFRQAIVDAVKAKDAARLREIYADGFSHTHGSGKVDGKDTRIVAVLAGDPSIEMAPADELSIRAFGTDTAIVTGRSPILNVRENRDYDFRWIAVYVRIAGEWRLAASQATRLPVKP